MKFASDSELGYCAARSGFAPDETLQFDQAYRRAHLPLVNPTHAKVITAAGDYLNGRYTQRRYSLVVPINAAALDNSNLFVELDAHIRCSKYADEIAWSIMAQRRAMLHATLCGGFTEAQLPALITSLHQWTSNWVKPEFLIGGLFNGNLNTGRLYFKIYPEVRGEKNTFQTIQQAAGTTPTAIWLAGYYNLHQELNAVQTQHLAATLVQFENQIFLQQSCQELWLLATNDDLALSAEIVQRFPFA